MKFPQISKTTLRKVCDEKVFASIVVGIFRYLYKIFTARKIYFVDTLKDHPNKI